MGDILLKIDENVLPNLARTIMSKTGRSEPMTISQFAEEIDSISGSDLPNAEEVSV